MHARCNGYLVSPLGGRHVRVDRSKGEADLRSRRLSMAERPCSSRHALTTTSHFILRHNTEPQLQTLTPEISPSGVKG